MRKYDKKQTVREEDFIMKAIRTAICFILVCMLCTALSSCSGSGKLSKHWVLENMSETSDWSFDQGKYMPVEMDLKETGTGTCYIPFYSNEDVSWSAKGSTLHIETRDYSSLSGFSNDYTFKFSGAKLTLTIRHGSDTFTATFIEDKG